MGGRSGAASQVAELADEQPPLLLVQAVVNFDAGK